jgi:hypothetical protein
LELEDAIDYSKFFSFAPPDLLKIFPPAKVIDAMRVRLDTERPPTPTWSSASSSATPGRLRPGDPPRRGRVPRPPARAHRRHHRHYQPVIYQLLGGQTTPADALQAGDITITGDTATAHDFFTYFDPPSKDPIKLIVR